MVVATAYPETGYEPQHGVESNRRETTIGVRRQNARTMDRLPSQVRGTAPSDKASGRDQEVLQEDDLPAQLDQRIHALRRSKR